MMISEGDALALVLSYYGFPFDHFQRKSKIICPFHNDINPSMNVDIKDGIWYCFGCGESGNAFKFVKMMERLKGKNDLSALQVYNSIISGKSSNDTELQGALAKRTFDGANESQSKRQLYAEAYDYYHGLKRVRWASPDSLNIEEQEALDYMQSRGFDAQTLIECDARVTYRDSYSLIFPMLDNGKFKGWVSRTMDPLLMQRRKYLYNKGFSRSNTVVGNYKDKDVIYVVEGYMDRLKLLQLGLKDVVAILGWKATDNQIEKLKAANIKLIVSALDNDDCGKKGTKWLSNHFEVVRWRYLKGIKDPGDFDEQSFEKMFLKTKKDIERKEIWAS